jgi:hypothetical protein
VSSTKLVGSDPVTPAIATRDSQQSAFTQEHILEDSQGMQRNNPNDLGIAASPNSLMG